MNDESNNWEELFDQLPVDVSVDPDRRDDLKARLLDTFEDTSVTPSATSWLKKTGAILMRYRVPHCTVAAGLIALLVWTTGLGGASALALDEVVSNLTSARTARFDMTVRVTGLPEQKMKAFYREPSHFRQELSHGNVNIADWAAQKMISLNTIAKRAIVFNLKNVPQQAGPEAQMNQFEATRDLLRRATSDSSVKVESLGEKRLNDRDVVGFRIETPAQPLTVWADPETKFPVQIEATMIGPPESHIVMSNYEFNIELDDALFSTTIPDDFEVVETDLDASQPTEEDFIAALKIGSEGSDGRFPPGFDAAATASYVAGMLARQAGSGEAKLGQAQMQQVMKISRGLQFAAQLPADAEAHYTGDSVKYGEKDRPLFWYRPSGAPNYRVIYGDLSVKESPDAPQAEGAKRLSGQGQ